MRLRETRREGETRRVRVRTRDRGARPRRQKRLRERGHDNWRSGAARFPPAADARVGVAAARLELGLGLDVGMVCWGRGRELASCKET